MAEPPADVSQQSESALPGAAACQVARVLALFVGVGCLTLLPQKAAAFLWIPGVVGGLAALAAVLSHRVKLAGGLRAFARGLGAGLKARLARLMGRKAGAPPADEVKPWPAFASRTAWTGALLVLAALLDLGLRAFLALEPGRLQIYLGALAILVWIAEQVLFIRPWFITGFERVEGAAGLPAGVLRAVGGLLLWVFLGASTVAGQIAWLFGVAGALVALGVWLGLRAERSHAAEVAAQAATSTDARSAPPGQGRPSVSAGV